MLGKNKKGFFREIRETPCSKKNKVKNDYILDYHLHRYSRSPA